MLTGAEQYRRGGSRTLARVTVEAPCPGCGSGQSHHDDLRGQRVRPGREAEPITRYTVLATIEAAYTLPREVRVFTVARITNIWLPRAQIPPDCERSARDVQETRTRDRDDRA